VVRWLGEKRKQKNFLDALHLHYSMFCFVLVVCLFYLIWTPSEKDPSKENETRGTAAPLFSALGPISLGPLLEQNPTQKARAVMSNTLVDLSSSMPLP
jgi:heme A synthase